METVQTQISEKLSKALNPIFISIENESYKHNVPKGSESHFKIIVVSELFQSKSRLQRHRIVNDILKAELEGPVHALAQKLISPQEWKSSEGSKDFQTPDCHGGETKKNK